MRSWDDGRVMNHLSEAQFVAVVTGTLTRRQLGEVDAHVDRCPDCRTLLARALGGAPPGGPAPLLEPPADALRIGERVGPFRVTGVVGEGGMGRVYSGEQKGDAQPVALKVLRSIRSSPMPGKEAEARLVREARLMSALDHPNVVRVQTLLRHRGRAVLVMELVRGASCAEWLRQAPPTTSAIVSVFTQAALGLAAAHRMGVVHRDFKPENILVREDGRAQVTDFGLARELGPADAGELAAVGPEGIRTQTGVIVGTPAYLAPEVLAGQPATALSDQFSFAVAFYLALYRRRPFEGTSVREYVGAVRRGELCDPPASERERRPLWPTLKRALALSPLARFARMDDLVEELQRRSYRSRS